MIGVIFSVSLVIIGIAIIVWIVRQCEYEGWIEDIKDGAYKHLYYPYGRTAKMDWRTIKKIYALNPRRFKYEQVGLNRKMQLLYNGGGNDHVWSKESTVSIILSCKDWEKLKKAYKKQEDMEVAKQENEDLQFVIESAQRDIERLKEQSKNEINQASDKMKEILERMLSE